MPVPKAYCKACFPVGNCGKGIQSDRDGLGVPRYRERHSVECITNYKSITAHRIDEQIGAILQAVKLQPNWMKRMAELAIADRNGADPKELEERKRRLGKAYFNGAFNDSQYEAELEEIARE